MKATGVNDANECLRRRTWNETLTIMGRAGRDCAGGGLSVRLVVAVGDNVMITDDESAQLDAINTLCDDYGISLFFRSIGGHSTSGAAAIDLYMVNPTDTLNDILQGLEKHVLAYRGALLVKAMVMANLASQINDEAKSSA